jgi:hypothetical protein
MCPRQSQVPEERALVRGLTEVVPDGYGERNPMTEQGQEPVHIRNMRSDLQVSVESEANHARTLVQQSSDYFYKWLMEEAAAAYTTRRERPEMPSFKPEAELVATAAKKKFDEQAAGLVDRGAVSGSLRDELMAMMSRLSVGMGELLLGKGLAQQTTLQNDAASALRRLTIPGDLDKAFRTYDESARRLNQLRDQVEEEVEKDRHRRAREKWEQG